MKKKICTFLSYFWNENIYRGVGRNYGDKSYIFIKWQFRNENMYGGVGRNYQDKNYHF